MSSYYVFIAVFAAIATIGALGTFVLTGMTGLFSLGQGAFMGIGAYVAAIAAVYWGLPFPLAMLMGVAVALVLAAMIGYATLKLRQDYFALATFGFGEAIRAVMNQSVQVTGGAMGMSGVPKYTTPLIVIISLMAVVWLVRNFKNSKFGRDCAAIRSDPMASEVLGINTFAHKMKLFLFAAALAAYAGGLMAFFTTYVEPAMFGWMRSAEWIIMVFFGGRYSLAGTVLGVVTLSALPEVLRFASELRSALYCIIILLIINFRPAGVLGRWELSLAPLKRLFSRSEGGAPRA